MINTECGSERRITGEEMILKYLQKTAALLVAVLLLLTMTTTAMATEANDDVKFTKVNETVYAITVVNIRSGPDKTYSRLGMLSYGDSIQRIGVGENGWSKVDYHGQTAYMYSEYLTKIQPVGIDYAQLSRQISIASGLREANFTAESWKVLTEAMNEAKAAMGSTSQETVDECTANLEAAISQLSGTNRGTLQDSLEDADAFTSDEKRSIWFELVEAVTQGRKLLGSNDQTAIDAAAEKIDELLAKAQVIWEDLNTPEVVTPAVQVEVPPQDDYCNIPKHRLWPVLFFCSLSLNVALVGVIVYYIYKKKNQKDDTPLVDYDISDDM